MGKVTWRDPYPGETVFGGRGVLVPFRKGPNRSSGESSQGSGQKRKRTAEEAEQEAIAFYRSLSPQDRERRLRMLREDLEKNRGEPMAESFLENEIRMLLSASTTEA